MARKPTLRKGIFDQYKTTTKEQRIAQRKKLQVMMKTERYAQWLQWVFEIQRKECFYCDNVIDLNVRSSYHVEHRIPIYYGGKSIYKNICLACPDCNNTKGTDQLIRNKAFLNRKNESRIAQGRTPAIYL